MRPPYRTRSVQSSCLRVKTYPILVVKLFPALCMVNNCFNSCLLASCCLTLVICRSESRSILSCSACFWSGIFLLSSGSFTSNWSALKADIFFAVSSVFLPLLRCLYSCCSSVVCSSVFFFLATFRLYLLIYQNLKPKINS